MFVPDRSHWQHRSVAVTGASGFLGGHLVAQLLDAGARVVVLVRDAVPLTPIHQAWADRVSVVRGACEDQAVMERMLGEYEVRTLFHLAAQSQVGVANLNPPSTFEANVAGTWATLEAARRSPRVEAIITASSDKAYGDQPVLPYTEEMPLLGANPYDASKACADIVARSYHHTYGLPVVVTRCGNFFGPGDDNWERLVPSAVRSLVRGEAPMIRSDGTMVRDYLYVVDGALAYLHTAEALAADPTLAGEAFNFSTEHPLTVLEVVAEIARAVGTTIEPVVLAEARNEIQAQFLAAGKARARFGWAPTVTFADAVDQTVAWYRTALDDA